MAAQALDALLQQARPEIRAMHPYEPGKPVETLERELGIREAIKLASNENPRGPGATVREALARAASDLSRYPDGSAHAFREKLAAQQGLHPDQILLGNGSNDVLELIARVFLAPGTKGVIDQYAFVVYPLAIAGAGGTVCAVPSKDYGHDLPAMAAAVDDATRLLFIANPNNPTGTVASLAEIESLLQAVPANVLVVVDEAYCEYQHSSPAGTALSLLPRYPNLVVTRTFSKIYGMAGLRAGLAFARPPVLDRIRPYGVGFVPSTGMVGALGGGCEFVMHAAHRVFALESYVGLVEAGVGLIPAGGGSWTEFNVTQDQIADRVGSKIAIGAPRLWDYAKQRIAVFFAALDK